MIKVANRRTLGLTGVLRAFLSVLLALFSIKHHVCEKECISCLKEGRECHSALKRVEEMWDKPLEKLEKVDNPTETDETENEKNELVILDCADN